MGADPWLRLPDRSDQLADGVLGLAKQLQDLQPRRIAEHSKESSCGSSASRNDEDGIHIWQTGYHNHCPEGWTPCNYKVEDIRQVATTRDKKGREVVNLVEMAEAISSAMPKLDATGQKIAVVIYRLLAESRPASLDAIAREADLTAARVEDALKSWPGVYRNGEGHVVGFWGLAIGKLEPEYRIGVDAKTSFAWCALDTLFIPAFLGKTVSVKASDPVTGKRVSLVVDRHGVCDVKPAGTVVSMVVPNGPFGYDVIESFCHRVLFFASKVSGAKWTAEHEGTTLLSVQEAFEVGRALTVRVAPDLFGTESGRPS